MVSQGHIAVRAVEGEAAVPAEQERGEPAPVEEQNGLFAPLQAAAEGGGQVHAEDGPGGRLGPFLFTVGRLDGGHRDCLHLLPQVHHRHRRQGAAVNALGE